MQSCGNFRVVTRRTTCYCLWTGAGGQWQMPRCGVEWKAARDGCKVEESIPHLKREMWLVSCTVWRSVMAHFLVPGCSLNPEEGPAPDDVLERGEHPFLHASSTSAVQCLGRFTCKIDSHHRRPHNMKQILFCCIIHSGSWLNCDRTPPMILTQLVEAFPPNAAVYSFSKAHEHRGGPDCYLARFRVASPRQWRVPFFGRLW